MLDLFRPHKRPAPSLEDCDPQDGTLVRDCRPGDFPAVRRLYREGLLEGEVDPTESTRDVDDPLSAYAAHPDDRFWVAEHEGQIVGMIGVVHIGHHIAQVRRLRVDRRYRHTRLPAKLLRVVLQHCRACGDLKLIVDTHVDPHQAVAACNDGGFQYARARRNGGHTILEFYLNLYQLPACRDSEPRRVPRPPQVHHLSA